MNPDRAAEVSADPAARDHRHRAALRDRRRPADDPAHGRGPHLARDLAAAGGATRPLRTDDPHPDLLLAVRPLRRLQRLEALRDHLRAGRALHRWRGLWRHLRPDRREPALAGVWSLAGGSQPARGRFHHRRGAGAVGRLAGAALAGAGCELPRGASRRGAAGQRRGAARRVPRFRRRGDPPLSLARSPAGARCAAGAGG